MNAWLVIALLAWQSPDLIDEGRKALDANHTEEAAALFQKAVDQNPKDYTAHFHLALADSLLQHDPEAVSEYQRTLALEPTLYQANLNLGMVLLRDKRPDDAITPLKAAVSAKAAEYRPNYYLAEALLASGKPAEAQPFFEAALKAKPGSATAELGLGRTLLRQAQLEAAEAHYRKAAEIDPEDHEFLLEVADAFDKAQHKADAIRIYQEFPANAGAQARLGDLLIDSKQFAEAIPRLEQAVSASPTTSNRLALANAYRLNKQIDKQDEQLSKTVATDPNNYDVRMMYGRSLRDQRKFVPAANQFLAAAKVKPDSKEAWNELASVLIVHEDYAQGLAALDKVKALGAETAGNHYLRAITLDKIRLRPQALESYRAFLAVSDGKFPDQEFLARQRIRIIETELHKR